jgi:hypothetical protein
MNAPSFSDTLARRAGGPLRRARVTTLQVNLGRRCDLACHHCHVEASPKRTEMMDRRTADRWADAAIWPATTATSRPARSAPR